jgi:hypothetical protein
MSEAAAPDDFDLHVLNQIERLFGTEKLETLFESPQHTADGRLDVSHMGILVKHLPTGREASCDKYPSQIKNKICCLLTLLLDFPARR